MNRSSLRVCSFPVRILRRLARNLLAFGFKFLGRESARGIRDRYWHFLEHLLVVVAPLLGVYGVLFVLNEISERSVRVGVLVRTARNGWRGLEGVLPELARRGETEEITGIADALDGFDGTGTLALRGQACLLSGRPDDARQIFEHLLLHGQNPDFLMNLAKAYGELGWTDDAVCTYQQGDKLWPDDPVWPVTRGQYLASLGHLREAGEAFDRALEIDVTSDAALSGRLAVMVSRYDGPEVDTWVNADMAACRSLLAKRGRDEAILEKLGELAFLAEDFNGAADWFRQALAISPNAQSVCRNLGEALSRLGNLDEAAQMHDAWFVRHIHSGNGQDLRQHCAAAKARGIPGMLLVGMQKSATEYIRELFVSAYDLPILYATLGTIPLDRPLPSVLRFLRDDGGFCRTHADGSALMLRGFTEAGFDRIVVHVRDPRPVMVSWVHMMRRLDPNEFHYSRTMYSPFVPEAFASWELSEQMSWAIDNYLPGQVAWLESWAEASEKTSSVIFTRFDDLVTDEQQFMTAMALDFAVDPEPLLRKLEETNKTTLRNFRKGSISEWASELSARQIDRINANVPGALIKKFGWDL